MINIENFREYCLSKPHTTEGMPFGNDVLVFKVGTHEKNKMFALCGLEPFDSINLKCDPQRAIELREEYSGIIPGYHMNKQHWNTCAVDGSIPEELIWELVDHSYELILSSLPKGVQKTIRGSI